MMGFNFLANGRRIKLEVMRITAAEIAIAYIPVLERIPIAAVHQRVAAVFIPRTEPLSLKITPLHKNPTPDMMLLPTRNIWSDP